MIAAGGVRARKWRCGAARVVGAALVGLVTMCAAGCGSTGLTAPRLAASIAPTFASLYVQQQLAQGHPRPVQDELRPQASCVKGAPSQNQQGAGNDWVCYVSYLAAGPATRVTATYNVTVQTNGCYARTVTAPPR